MKVLTISAIKESVVSPMFVVRTVSLPASEI